MNSRAFVRFLGVFIQEISKMSIAKCPFHRYIISHLRFLYRFLSLFNFLNRDKEAPTSWKSKLKNKLPHLFTFIIAFSLTIIKCFLIFDYIFIHKVSYKKYNALSRAYIVIRYRVYKIINSSFLRWSRRESCKWTF